MNNGENFNIENKFVNYDSNNKEKKKSKKFIIIILLILLLGIAGYLFYVNKVEKESNEKNNDNYEEYDPNYKIEESNSNITSNITSNTTSNIESNISSNITSNIESNITSNIISNVTSNVVKSNSNKTSNTQSKVSVIGVKLSSTKLTMTVGDTKSISATVTPSNATNKGVTWTSSNTSVATVSSNGKITAKKAGTSTITVKTRDGGKTAKLTLTVVNKNIPVQGISITSKSDSMYVLNSVKATATITPSNATNKSVKWTSSNPSVATVDQNGNITGKAVGTTTITATASNGKSVTKKYSVLKNPYIFVFVRITAGGGEGGVHVIYSIIARKDNSPVNFSSFTYNGKTYTSNTIAAENININKSITSLTMKLTTGETVVVPITYS